MQQIVVNKLMKEYGKIGKGKIAIDNISLTINSGEFVIIIGVSGSGKSTLLNIIGGLDFPSSGTVLYDNTDIYSQTDDYLTEYRREKIGMVSQTYNLVPLLTAKENITLPILLSNKVIDENKILYIAKKLNIVDCLNKFPEQLSGGQQQRVSIARALAKDSEVILADEPTGNLDTDNTDEVMNLLNYINKDLGKTVIMITHNNDLIKYANRIITISDGQIIREEVKK